MNKNITNQREIVAEHKHARVSASKVRLVAKMIKKYSVVDAKEQLKYIHKKGAGLIFKVLNSAIANAEHNFGLKIEDLEFKAIEVTEGPTLRRWRARSRGMGNRINKRTSHIKVVLMAEKKLVATPKDEKKKEQKKTETKEVAKSDKKAQETKKQDSKGDSKEKTADKK